MWYSDGSMTYSEFQEKVRNLGEGDLFKIRYFRPREYKWDNLKLVTNDEELKQMWWDANEFGFLKAYIHTKAADVSATAYETGIDVGYIEEVILLQKGDIEEQYGDKVQRAEVQMDEVQRVEMHRVEVQMDEVQRVEVQMDEVQRAEVQNVVLEEDTCGIQVQMVDVEDDTGDNEKQRVETTQVEEEHDEVGTYTELEIVNEADEDEGESSDGGEDDDENQTSDEEYALAKRNRKELKKTVVDNGAGLGLDEICGIGSEIPSHSKCNQGESSE